MKQQKSMATIPTVMVMAISELPGYFYGIKYTFYFDGVFLVLITGITRALTVGIHFHFDTMLGRWGSPWIQNRCL